MTNEMGYPSALSAPRWGFYDVLFKSKPFAFDRGYGSYVMENVLFKISFPAEFHAQTAVECALTLHAEIKDKLDKIAKVTIETQEPGVRIIDKTGPLANPADRDHCIQYMTAIPLLFGRLSADDYEDAVAQDPRVDALRAKMVVTENPAFTKDYYDPAKRYIGNAVQVFFTDGTASRRVAVDFPDRAPQAARRRDSKARREVRGERRGAFRAEAGCHDRRAVRRQAEAARDPRQ